MPPVWPSRRPADFHEGDGSNRCISSTSRSTSSPIPGRLAVCGSIRRRSETGSGGCGVPDGETGVYGELLQVCPDASARAAVLGIYYQHRIVDTLPTVRQAEEAATRVQAGSAQEWSNVHNVAIHLGDNGSSSPCHHASSSQRGLQFLLQTAETNGDYAKMTIWASEDLHWWTTLSPRRGGEQVHLHREHSHSTPCLDHIGRIVDRLGCGHLGEDSLRPLAEVRIARTHQLEGAASSFPGPSSARQQGTIHHQPNGDGEPDRSCICQSPRRDHVPSALPTRLGDVEVGNRAGSHPDSRPCARQGQYDCGPPLAAN